MLLAALQEAEDPTALPHIMNCNVSQTTPEPHIPQKTRALPV